MPVLEQFSDVDSPFTVTTVELPADQNVRLCACGCGEKLKAGTRDTYKRGHKLAAAAADTDDDPEPNPQDNAEARTYTASRITKKMRDDIQGKVAFLADILAQLWASKDTVCGPVAQETVPAFSAALVPILCRSPEVVRYLTKGGNFSMVMDLLLTLVPLSKVLSQHHVFHSIGQPAENFDATIYRLPGA